MNTRRLFIVIASILVVVMLAFVAQIALGPGAPGALRSAKGAEKLAASLKTIQSEAEQSLARARAIEESVANARRRLGAPKGKPFLASWAPAAAGGSARGPGEADGQGSALELKGIALAGDNSLAVIGGEVYAKGARIGAFQVAEIYKDRVVLASSGGAKITLPLTGWTARGVQK